MVLLQPKLNLKVTQKQILTPGLVQMVSVLALNKLELKDMINAEIVENPVLEEMDSTVPLLDEVASREEDRERVAAADEPIVQAEKKDPFDEIDFGSYFQDYLDPGYRTSSYEMEQTEKPSFENFLSKPGSLHDHLSWQLGAMNLSEELREAADLVIGNLNEDGYLIATDEELLAAANGQEVEAPRSSDQPDADAEDDEEPGEVPAIRVDAEEYEVVAVNPERSLRGSSVVQMNAPRPAVFQSERPARVSEVLSMPAARSK